MIAKGTTHNNGARLAAYMETSKDGERADLWQLRGFVATTIKDAFRDAQIMAGATKAQQPFFHVQVRNREGEKLTRQQWEYAADRIERMLGLVGQPRAIAFHTYEHNDDEHMHVAWSRIDQDKMTARPLPFFKRRLKTLSRELELEFVLEPVTNHREGSIKFAPTKAQDEQARRLGVDIHEVRNSIRNCWDRSDCGMSFQGALEHEGLTLAQGERRDFIVIDRAGGVHALGKRILDMTAPRIRERLSDLSRDELPTLEMVRDLIRETQEEKQFLREKPAPVWDRDRDDRMWQDAVMNAAIEKEKVAKEFVEPVAQKTRSKAGSRKEDGRSLDPPQERTEEKPLHTAAPPQAINGRDDFFALGTVATTKLEAQKREQLERQQAERQRARARGHSEAGGRELWMAQQGGYDALSPELKIKAEKAYDKWKNHGGGQGSSYNVNAYVSYVQEKWTARPLDSRVAKTDTDVSRLLNGIGRDLKAVPAKAIRVVAALPVRAAGKLVHAFADAAASLLAPTLTPQQIYEGEQAKGRRDAQADRAIDFSRITTEAAQQRQQQEQEARRQRDDGGGRER